MEETSKTSPQRDKKGRLLPGQVSLNPNGRPKLKTIKERVREYLDQHPEDMDGFVKHFVTESRELAWQMLEGRPSQDVTTGGKSFNSLKDMPDEELERIAEGSEDGIS